MNPSKFIILILVIICLRSVKQMYEILQYSLRLCASGAKQQWQYLKWSHHCDVLKSKLNTGYYLINFLQKVTNSYVTRSLYFTCFHSHLKYGITLWGGDPHSVEIFKLQKKVIRAICKVDQLTSCRHLFKKLGILPLPCLFISEMVCCH